MYFSVLLLLCRFVILKIQVLQVQTERRWSCLLAFVPSPGLLSASDLSAPVSSHQRAAVLRVTDQDGDDKVEQADTDTHPPHYTTQTQTEGQPRRWRRENRRMRTSLNFWLYLSTHCRACVCFVSFILLCALAIFVLLSNTCKCMLSVHLCLLCSIWSEFTSFSSTQSFLYSAGVDEVLRSFTWIKVQTHWFRNTMFKVEVQHPKRNY